MIVLIATMDKQVVITDSFNPAPITGRMSIFNKVQAPTEMKTVVEIVGVYSDLELAGEARKAHAAAHPGRKYIQKVAPLDGGLPGPVEPPKCIKCGTPIGPVGSFCPPCQKAHYQECIDRDPRGGEGDLVPSPKTSYGFNSTLLNMGT